MNDKKRLYILLAALAVILVLAIVVAAVLIGGNFDAQSAGNGVGTNQQGSKGENGDKSAMDTTDDSSEEIVVSTTLSPNYQSDKKPPKVDVIEEETQGDGKNKTEIDFDDLLG